MMSRWAYVNNGTVEECYYDLPECWQNVSNLYLLANDLQTLANLGWYPVNDTTQPLPDASTHTYGPITYEFNAAAGTVYLIQPILEQSNAPSFDVLRANFMQNLRQQRDILLAQSDWTQLPDVVAGHAGDSSWQTLWQAYRQALRNLPQVYDSTYPQVTDAGQISWPDMPGG